MSIAVFLALSLLLAKTFVQKSGYFKLRSVEVRDLMISKDLAALITDELMRSYKDENIFDVDIKEIAKSLRSSHPDARNVAVMRELPDKIVVSFNFRSPVALIGNEKRYPVDDECFILTSMDASSLKGLPIVVGVDIRYEEKRGKKCESKNLKVALELLKAIKKSDFLNELSINTIDAGDIKGMSFYLANGLEIRIGDENFSQRLEVLKKTLRNPRLVVDRIKYIDLRFEEVVIGPK